MGSESNQPNQDSTAFEDSAVSNKDRIEHQFGDPHDRSRFSRSNRRRFLAATAGVCLGAGVASTGIDRAAGANTGDHLLEITGTGSHATYRFTASENLEKSTANGGTISAEDRIFNQNRSASGAVSGGTDAYTFDGDLVAFDLDGAVNVLLDGQPAHVGQRPDHFLQIIGSGTHAGYSFTASNDLEKSTAGDGTISAEDRIFNQNRSASGAVSGGTDAYTFDGDLVAFDLDGTVNVLLDGRPAHVGQRPEHFLQIEGQGSYTTYSFTVSNNLEKSTAGGGTISGEDRITNQNRSASGAVSGGTDAYTFDGNLRAFDFDGEVNVLLDGQPAHVGRLPDSVEASPPEVVWNRRYDNPTIYGTANSVVPTTDGGYAFAGQTDREGWLVKTDAAGNRQWERFISGVDTLSSLVQTRDGGYALAGTLHGKVGLAEIYGQLIETDADGTELWRKKFHNRIPNDLLQTRDGDVTLAGEKREYDDSRSSGGWAAQITGEGEIRWSQTFGNQRGDTFASVAKTRDGGYIFAGDKGKGRYSRYGWAVKTASTGHEQWSRTYDRDTVGTFTSVQRASTGGYVLAGYKDELAWAVHIDEMGEVQWNRTYGNTSKYVFRRFEAHIPVSDGGHVLAGEIFYPNVDAVTGWVQKIDAAGDRVWSRSGLAPPDYTNGYLYDLVRAHDEGFVAAGTAGTEVDSGGDGGWMVKLA